MNVITCENCGKSYSPSRTSCPYCGAKKPNLSKNEKDNDVKTILQVSKKKDTINDIVSTLDEAKKIEKEKNKKTEDKKVLSISEKQELTKEKFSAPTEIKKLKQEIEMQESFPNPTEDEKSQVLPREKHVGEHGFSFKFSKYKILTDHIPTAIFFMFALFTLLACAFSVHSVNLYPQYEYYAKLLGLNTYENGFHFLGNDSIAVGENLSGLNIPLRLFSWFVFAAGLFAVICAIMSLFLKNKYAKKLRFIAIIVGLVMLACYMVMGIVFTGIENKDGVWVNGIDNGYGEYLDKRYYSSVSTSAFFPFLFGTIFAVAYFTYMALIPKIVQKYESSDSYKNKKEMQQSVPQLVKAAPKREHTVNKGQLQSVPVVTSFESEKEKIEILKQYKQILDDGIISEEEFKKKKELLL